MDTRLNHLTSSDTQNQDHFNSIKIPFIKLNKGIFRDEVNEAGEKKSMDSSIKPALQI